MSGPATPRFHHAGATLETGSTATTVETFPAVGRRVRDPRRLHPPETALTGLSVRVSRGSECRWAETLATVKERGG